ncbi:MAG: SDR family oxidoreductase [Candidatus Parcubacteria bacterium]|nr:SDR family oxidoreductase [Candidatus Parcubacteria bacterium]
MNVLVVGGAGYVGSVLCEKLIGYGHTVVVCDCGFFGFAGLTLIEDKIKIMKKDAFLLNNTDMKNIECVINISGLSNDPTADFNSELNTKLNTELTYFLAKMSKTCGVKKFIFGSTCSIYDVGLDNEEKDILMSEESEVNPVRFYSLSKLAAERAILELQDKNFDVLCLRKATIFGYSPRMRYDLVVNTFIKDAIMHGKMFLHHGGEMWRPLININDVCEIYSRLVSENLNGIYNAVGFNIRVSEIALRIKESLRQLGVESDVFSDYKIVKSSLRSYRVSGEKLRKYLNFESSTTIQDSVVNIFSNIEKIKDFNNPVYYNIDWMKKNLQEWIKNWK